MKPPRRPPGRQLTVGSLFSGIGGIDLGLERAGMKVEWQCEIDPYCRRVLRRHWPMTWIFKDIKTLLTDEKFLQRPKVDVIAGGFPCQPFSQAGARKGNEDDRDLWPRMFEVIRAVRPRLVLAENVYGFLTWGGGVLVERTYSDLESAGYEVAPPFVLPAVAFDAKHQRDRVWIVARRRNDAHPHHPRLEGRQLQPVRAGAGERTVGAVGQAGLVPHPICGGRNGGTWRERQTHGRSEPAYPRISRNGLEWEPEPRLGRVANGVPDRVDRVKSLGNSVVPQVAEWIGRLMIASLEYGEE